MIEGCLVRIRPRARFAGALLVTVSLHAAGGVLYADAFSGYLLAETFSLPNGAGPFCVTPDGRTITIVEDDVFVETGPGARTFASLGTLPDADIPFFGAAFIAVSPDGATVAVGNNGGSSFGDFKVGVFDLATLSGTWFSANHFLGVWLDDTHLVLAASDFANGSSVTVLDTTSADPSAPLNTVVVDNIGGASGGIAFDAAGNLFVANGFTSIGPSDTGVVKAFAAAEWMSALEGGTPLDFEATGTLVVDILNGTPLGFDHEANLFVGGGSAPPDNDFVALIRASAVTAALAGAGPVDPDDASQVRRLDPIPGGENRYSAVFNAGTRELYVRDFGDTTVFAYRDFTGIPTVSEWGLATMTLMLATAGTLMLRRRGISSSERP